MRTTHVPHPHHEPYDPQVDYHPISREPIASDNEEEEEEEDVWQVGNGEAKPNHGEHHIVEWLTPETVRRTSHAEPSVRFGHQVAGHKFSEGKSGFLVSRDRRYIYKPMPGGRRESSEVHLYRHSHKLDARLKRFLPVARGLRHVPVAPENTPSLSDGESANTNNGNVRSRRYIMLENLVYGYKKPCAMDVKIGSVTYGPDMAAYRVRRRCNKERASTTPSHGFRLSGLKVYRHDKNMYESYDRAWGRKVAPNDIVNAVEIFFNDGRAIRIDLLVSFLPQLYDLHKAVVQHARFTTYASSILLLYDGVAPVVSLDDIAVRDDPNEEQVVTDANDSDEAPAAPSSSYSQTSDDENVEQIVNGMASASTTVTTSGHMLSLHGNDSAPQSANSSESHSSSDVEFLLNSDSDESPRSSPRSSASARRVPTTDVRWIDFAHLHPLPSHLTHDENVASGIANFAKTLEAVALKHHPQARRRIDQLRSEHHFNE